MIQRIYELLKEKTKDDKYAEIKNDIEIVDKVLRDGYYMDACSNVYNPEQVYEALWKKYGNDKIRLVGYYDFYSCYRRVIVNNVNTEQNKTTRNNLIALRYWIIRYWSYKVLVDEAKEDASQYYFRDNGSAFSRAAFENVLNIFDKRILDRLMLIR
ncbi:MAG: hypothetical protein IJH12_08680 [Clostridia bacterium]|nr:hypothetical protein [Clostridia bacterium]